MTSLQRTHTHTRWSNAASTAVDGDGGHGGGRDVGGALQQSDAAGVAVDWVARVVVPQSASWCPGHLAAAAGGRGIE